MPREIVHGSAPGDPDIEVVWTADKSVQIGVIPAEIILMFEHGSAGAAVLGQMAAAAYEWATANIPVSLEDGVPGVPDRSRFELLVGEKMLEELTEHRGLYSSNLDRQQCNDLIRDLRRARNAVHGRDE